MLKQNYNISLDKFIDYCLYNKKEGYYINKNPFGIKGDFVTAPNISRLYSEMLAIWTISFWESLGCPKKFNLIELGAGNGEMMKIMIESFKKFPVFLKCCNIMIYEKSPRLILEQKKKIEFKNIKWIKNFKNLKKFPNIFLANEFFDALPIKQFIKKKNKWFEKKVKKEKNGEFKLVDSITNIKSLEKKIGINLTSNQKIIEFSPLAFKFLNILSKKINSFEGGLLIIDYGYFEKKMRNSLQSVYKHSFNNIFDNLSKSDITYSLNFFLLKKIAKKLNLNVAGLTDQGSFLTNLGILHRAEIMSNNLKFTKKADIYYRLKRLIDKDLMGGLFKVMFLTKKNIKFKMGF